MQKTNKTTISRLAKRGVYEQETIYAILDEALYCTISYAQGNQPFSIPTGFCRIGNYLYIHGSVGSHLMRELAKGIPVCIAVTHMDALVLAKSAFHHSVNYRSVVAFSKALPVDDADEKMKALETFTEKLIPGRWKDCRWPNESEMRKTMVLKFELNEASAKVRQGPPSDDDEDMHLPHWAGLIHLSTRPTHAEPDEFAAQANIPYPGYYSL